jgi:hypothetical protein
MDKLEKSTVQQLASIYKAFCKTHPDLRYISTERITNDSFQVSIQVSDHYPTTQNSYSQMVNSCFTLNWAEQVRLPEALDLSKLKGLHMVTIKQLDNQGTVRSMAIL